MKVEGTIPFGYVRLCFGYVSLWVPPFSVLDTLQNYETLLVWQAVKVAISFKTGTFHFYFTNKELNYMHNIWLA